jgi:exonuclease VII small subunit
MLLPKTYGGCMRRKIVFLAMVLLITPLTTQVIAQQPPAGNSLNTRVSTLEQKVSSLENSTQNLQEAVASVQNTTQSLQQSVDGLQQTTLTLQQALDNIQNGCTRITVLPYVITAPGKYCLSGNLSTAITTGTAIQINADFVVLDLNGFGIIGALAGPDSHANGVYARDRKSITIKNGTVSNFYNGIFLEGSVSASGVVENVKLQSITFQAIRVEGQGHLIRNNHVMNTTGNPDAAGGGNGGSAAIGAYGSRNTIINNDVINTAAIGNGIGTGINLNASDHSVVENNRIVGTTGPVNPFGIFIGSSANVLVVNNRIITAQIGVSYSNSTGLYRDNIVSDTATPYQGGTDAGNNH